MRLQYDGKKSEYNHPKLFEFLSFFVVVFVIRKIQCFCYICYSVVSVILDRSQMFWWLTRNGMNEKKISLKMISALFFYFFFSIMKFMRALNNFGTLNFRLDFFFCFPNVEYKGRPTRMILWWIYNLVCQRWSWKSQEKKSLSLNDNGWDHSYIFANRIHNVFFSTNGFPTFLFRRRDAGWWKDKTFRRKKIDKIISYPVYTYIFYYFLPFYLTFTLWDLNEFIFPSLTRLT